LLHALRMQVLAFAALLTLSCSMPAVVYEPLQLRTSPPVAEAQVEVRIVPGGEATQVLFNMAGGLRDSVRQRALKTWGFTQPMDVVGRGYVPLYAGYGSEYSMEQGIAAIRHEAARRGVDAVAVCLQQEAKEIPESGAIGQRGGTFTGRRTAIAKFVDALFLVRK
jgi:hypothetical protein